VAAGGIDWVGYIHSTALGLLMKPPPSSQVGIPIPPIHASTMLVVGCPLIIVAGRHLGPRVELDDHHDHRHD
jgi:hypothetical protein